MESNDKLQIANKLWIEAELRNDSNLFELAIARTIEAEESSKEKYIIHRLIFFRACKAYCRVGKKRFSNIAKFYKSELVFGINRTDQFYKQLATTYFILISCIRHERGEYPEYPVVDLLLEQGIKWWLTIGKMMISIGMAFLYFANGLALKKQLETLRWSYTCCEYDDNLTLEMVYLFELMMNDYCFLLAQYSTKFDDPRLVAQINKAHDHTKFRQKAKEAPWVLFKRSLVGYEGLVLAIILIGVPLFVIWLGGLPALMTAFVFTVIVFYMMIYYKLEELEEIDPISKRTLEILVALVLMGTTLYVFYLGNLLSHFLYMVAFVGWLVIQVVGLEPISKISRGLPIPHLFQKIIEILLSLLVMVLALFFLAMVLFAASLV